MSRVTPTRITESFRISVEDSPSHVYGKLTATTLYTYMHSTFLSVDSYMLCCYTTSDG